MKFERKFICKKILYFRNARAEKFSVGMDEDEIVHISPVMSDFQILLDILVERMEIEIGEYLAREVADRESDSWGSEK